MIFFDNCENCIIGYTVKCESGEEYICCDSIQKCQEEKKKEGAVWAKLTRHAGLPVTTLVTATALHVRTGTSAVVQISTMMTTKYYILKRVHNIAQNIVLLCKQEIRQGVELNIHH